jgi:hypothetical protein
LFKDEEERNIIALSSLLDRGFVALDANLIGR